MKLLTGLALSIMLACASPAAATSADLPVKKSRTGICHAPGTTYYIQTKKFTPYKTLQACLASGGRRPKR